MGTQTRQQTVNLHSFLGARPRQLCRSRALLREALIALPAAKQVAPHGAPRGADICGLDSAGDGAMLGLNAFQIGPQLFACFEPDAHALARNEEAAEKFEKTHEMRILG